MKIRVLDGQFSELLFSTLRPINFWHPTGSPANSAKQRALFVTFAKSLCTQRPVILDTAVAALSRSDFTSSLGQRRMSKLSSHAWDGQVEHLNCHYWKRFNPFEFSAPTTVEMALHLATLGRTSSFPAIPVFTGMRHLDPAIYTFRYLFSFPKWVTGNPLEQPHCMHITLANLALDYSSQRLHLQYLPAHKLDHIILGSCHRIMVRSSERTSCGSYSARLRVAVL